VEKVRVHWSRNIRNDSKNIKSLEEVDCQNWRGVRERCTYTGERETLHWVEEYPCQVEWSWSCWETLSLLIESEGEIPLAERNGEWT